MKPDDIIKKAIHTKPDGKTEKDITPPIQITFLSDKQETGQLELSHEKFISILAKSGEVNNFTGCRITFDDGKKSYSFTLDVDQFIPTKTEMGNPMK